MSIASFGWPHARRMNCAGFYWYLQKFGDDRTQIVIADYALGVGASQTKAPFSLDELYIDGMGKLLDEAPRSRWDRSRFPYISGRNWLPKMRFCVSSKMANSKARKMIILTTFC